MLHINALKNSLREPSMESTYCLCLTDCAPGIMQTAKLASLEGGVVSQTSSAVDSGAALPTETMRCPGPVTLAGIREGVLWLIDARGTPFMIPMSHPGIQTRAAAAQGDLEAAINIAETGLGQEAVDAVIFVDYQCLQEDLHEERERFYLQEQFANPYLPS